MKSVLPIALLLLAACSGEPVTTEVLPPATNQVATEEKPSTTTVQPAVEEPQPLQVALYYAITSGSTPEHCLVTRQIDVARLSELHADYPNCTVTEFLGGVRYDCTRSPSDWEQCALVPVGTYEDRYGIRRTKYAWTCRETLHTLSSGLCWWNPPYAVDPLPLATVPN